MAVRVGFEPTLEQALNMISSHALSATQPPHREATRYYNSFSLRIKTARSERDSVRMRHEASRAAVSVHTERVPGVPAVDDVLFPVAAAENFS